MLLLVMKTTFHFNCIAYIYTINMCIVQWCVDTAGSHQSHVKAKIPKFKTLLCRSHKRPKARPNSERQVPFKYVQNDSFNARAPRQYQWKQRRPPPPHYRRCQCQCHVISSSISFNNRPTKRPADQKTDKDLSICAVLCWESKLIKTP